MATETRGQSEYATMTEFAAAWLSPGTPQAVAAAFAGSPKLFRV